MSDADRLAELTRVRDLVELAVELRIARLKVGEIEIVPSPAALRPLPPATPVTKPRSTAEAPDPEPGEDDELVAGAPPRRPTSREVQPEPKHHDLAYYSSKARS